MYNKVFKNYQVNVGIPYQVRIPVNIQTNRPFINFDEGDALQSEELLLKNPEYVLKKAGEEAQLIISEAELEASRLLSAAEKEANQNKENIESKARQAGYEEGYISGKKQYEDLIQEAEFIKEHAKTEYSEVLSSIESDAVDVILNIARKVISTELNVNKENIFHMVKQAFEKCEIKENINLRVSIDDYDFLIQNQDRLKEKIEGIDELKIKNDPALKVGSCIMETSFGSIDASAQTKFRKIEEAFMEVVGNKL